VAWGIQSGGVSSAIGFNISLYLESRATPGISASIFIKLCIANVYIASDEENVCFVVYLTLINHM
jgi:hypothetical protein